MYSKQKKTTEFLLPSLLNRVFSLDKKKLDAVGYKVNVLIYGLLKKLFSQVSRTMLYWSFKNVWNAH